MNIYFYVISTYKNDGKSSFYCLKAPEDDPSYGLKHVEKPNYITHILWVTRTNNQSMEKPIITLLEHVLSLDYHWVV